MKTFSNEVLVKHLTEKSEGDILDILSALIETKGEQSVERIIREFIFERLDNFFRGNLRFDLIERTSITDLIDDLKEALNTTQIKELVNYLADKNQISDVLNKIDSENKADIIVFNMNENSRALMFNALAFWC